MPRIRIRDGCIEFGEDKLQENFVPQKFNCRCTEKNTNGFCCRDSYNEMAKEYISTFNKKASNYLYKIISFKVTANDIYLFPVAKHWVNQFDIPIVDKRLLA